MRAGNRDVRLVLVLLAALGLGACGGDEPKQRTAFIQFLQERIVGKPGVHVPKLTAEQTAAFGDYAKHYAVIADFNAALDSEVGKPMQRAIEAGAPHSLDDLPGRRNDIAAARDGLAKIRAALDGQLATADAAHAALKQPAELKTVYDQAYDRDVTQPAKAMVDIFPTVDAATRDIITLADFLAQHRNAVQLQGSLIRVSDPALQRQLQTMLDALRTHRGAIQDAQRKLRAVIYGG